MVALGGWHCECVLVSGAWFMISGASRVASCCRFHALASFLTAGWFRRGRFVDARCGLSALCVVCCLRCMFASFALGRSVFGDGYPFLGARSSVYAFGFGLCLMVAGLWFLHCWAWILWFS